MDKLIVLQFKIHILASQIFAHPFGSNINFSYIFTRFGEVTSFHILLLLHAMMEDFSKTFSFTQQQTMYLHVQLLGVLFAMRPN